MAIEVPLVRQLWEQGPRFQIDDDLVLIITPVAFEGNLPQRGRAAQLRVEWAPGSCYDVLGEVTPAALDTWILKLVQGLNRTLGEGLPSVAIPALRP